jgi:Cu+-exporting ATPase
MLSNNIQPNKIIRMEKVNWKVDGMTCTNCALSVSKVLQNQGLQKVSVNAITGDVVFETEEANGTLEKAKKNIEGLGYKVVSEEKDEETATKRKFLGSHLQKFFFLPAIYIDLDARSPGHVCRCSFPS